MESVNIARLRDGLCAYLAKVRKGEEIIIRDRNHPIAKLVPLPTDDLTEEERELVAAGLMKPAKEKLDVDALLRIPVAGGATLEEAIAAALAERGDDR